MNKENRLINFALEKGPSGSSGKKSEVTHRLDTRKIEKREKENERRRKQAEKWRKEQRKADIEWSQMVIDQKEEEKRSREREKLRMKKLEKALESKMSENEIAKKARAIIEKPGARGKVEDLKEFIKENTGEKNEVKVGRVIFMLENDKLEARLASGKIFVVRDDDDLDILIRRFI